MKFRFYRKRLLCCICYLWTVLLIGTTPGSAWSQSSEALIDAAKRGQLDKVQTLLSLGVDVNSSDKNGKTALMEAARTGRNDVVKALIDAKADLNAQDKDGWTAPMRAVMAAQSVTLKTLVDAGADITLTNNKGKTAYMIAKEYGTGNMNPELFTILTGSAGTAKSAPASSSGPTQETQTLGTAKGKPIETKFFGSTLPDGWEVLADDLDKMGMMTLAKKGTGGSKGIYIKFEGNGAWTGTPEEAVASFAKSKKGTEPAKITLNGIDYFQTAYDSFGSHQSMLVTKKDGTKITLTILGEDYTRSADVKLFFDTLILK